MTVNTVLCTKNRLLFLFLVVFLQSFAMFQINASVIPTVAVYSVVSDTQNDQLQRTITDLIFSFLKDERSWKLIDMRSEIPPGFTDRTGNTDYVFYGTLESVPEGVELELVLRGGSDFVTRTISKVYENSNRILLESRALVKDLFDLSSVHPSVLQESASAKPLPPPSETASPLITLVPVSTLDDLAGNWYGEAGIEKIMILRGGRAVAVLTSGISISLDLFLSGGDLIIRQKGAVTSRQFTDLPELVAKQAAVISPPLEWRFRKAADSRVLSGTKKTVHIQHDGKNILKMESEVLEVQWYKE